MTGKFRWPVAPNLLTQQSGNVLCGERSTSVLTLTFSCDGIPYLSLLLKNARTSVNLGLKIELVSRWCQDFVSRIGSFISTDTRSDSRNLREEFLHPHLPSLYLSLDIRHMVWTQMQRLLKSELSFYETMTTSSRR